MWTFYIAKQLGQTFTGCPIREISLTERNLWIAFEEVSNG